MATEYIPVEWVTCAWIRWINISVVCQCVISDRSRCGYSLSQMLAGVLLPWWAGALCPVSAWHFPREGGAASLRPLPRQRRPRPCRSTKHLLLCRWFSVHADNVKHVFLILWSVLIQPSLLCSTKSRPVSNGVLLQRRVQTLSAVPSGRLPTRFGTDTVLPLWGRTEHQAGRCQLLPWLWSQRLVCALFSCNQRRKIYSNNLQNRPHLMCFFIPAVQSSVLQVITTTPQYTGVSAAQWGRIRQSLDRTTVSPARATPPLILMVQQVSRSARVSMKITVLCCQVS